MAWAMDVLVLARMASANRAAAAPAEIPLIQEEMRRFFLWRVGSAGTIGVADRSCFAWRIADSTWDFKFSGIGIVW